MIRSGAKRHVQLRRPGAGQFGEVHLPEDERAQLVERVAGSVSFQRSPQLRKLFLYLCQIAGKSSGPGVSEHQIGIVDGHRTVALAISPFIRRSVVDSNNYNHTSMIRTIQEIFRVPPRTRFLKSARPMTSMFTAQAESDALQTP